MKYLLLTLTLIFSLAAAEIPINGHFSGNAPHGLPQDWSFNPYQGHRPYPQIKRGKNSIQFFDIKGQSGFGVNSRLFPASPGDTLTIYAQVRGSGKASFAIHLWTKNNKWIAMEYVKFVPLAKDWKKVEISFPVTNKRPGFETAQARIMIGSGHGHILEIKDLKVVNRPGRYIAGRGGLPLKWKVFGPLKKDFAPSPADLLSIPAVLGGQKARNILPEGTTFDLKSFFGNNRKDRCLWLFNEIIFPGPRELTIGAGADWWMAVYLNGKVIIDTTPNGNGEGKLDVSNHLGTAWLKKGKNILAVKFIPGTGSAKLCIGGPDDLKGKENHIIVKHVFSDDFEKPGSRPGNPQIITGLLSHGLLVETKQGVYSAASPVIPPQTADIPAALPDARFAISFRLYSLAGKMTGDFGKARLILSSRGNTIAAELFSQKKKIFTLPVAQALLPADFLFSFSREGRCTLTVKSLADSSRHERKARIPLPRQAALSMAPQSSAVLDQLAAGLAVPAGKKKSFPLKLTPAKTFDPVKAGWKLAFEENFNGGKIDLSRWEVTNPDNVTLDGKGNLRIKADVNAQKKLSSGGLKTRDSFGYGWYEARLKFTRQQGWWSSFWLWGTGHHPMLDGIEIDVYEDYYTRKAQPGEPLILDHNLHTSTGNTGKSWNYLSRIPAEEFAGYHTIACKRTPFEISQYLDGRLISSSASHSNYDGVVFDPVSHGGATAKLNAIFSGIPMRAWGKKWSDPAKGKFPEYFVVDHFRFYEYPIEKAPETVWKNSPDQTLLMRRPGAKMSFEAEAFPSSLTNSPVKELYLMDNGAVIASINGSKGRFEIAVDPLYYNNTPYMNPGRSGIIPKLDGLHGFSVFAKAADGMGSFAAPPRFIMIVPDLPTRPYLGKAAQIPGTLNPAFYDEGGNGTAYSDDKGNFFNKQGRKPFRPGEDVDTAGQIIGRVVSGEWLKYTVDIAETGEYSATLTCGTPIQNRKHTLYLFVDGEEKPAAEFVIPPHKETHWGCQTKVTVGKIKLPAGRKRLVLVPVGLFNFGSIQFSKIK